MIQREILASVESCSPVNSVGKRTECSGRGAHSEEYGGFLSRSGADCNSTCMSSGPTLWLVDCVHFLRLSSGGARFAGWEMFSVEGL
uniref:Uncharacterized protein n=1 Tax=Cannabis sativa TaxID=3483 RepID=A0A803P960_CANSA